MKTDFIESELKRLAKSIDRLGDFVLTHLNIDGKTLVIYLAKNKQPKMPMFKLTFDNHNNYQLVVYPITIEPELDDDINLTQYSLVLDMIYNCVTDFSSTKRNVLKLISKMKL